eukprot:4670125-Pleurochrysis_carterae.AAC.1
MSDDALLAVNSDDYACRRRPAFDGRSRSNGRTSRVCTSKQVRRCTSWMSRLPLPDPRPERVLRDHPFPSCVGRCLRACGHFRHCYLICKCFCVSVEIKNFRGCKCRKSS